MKFNIANPATGQQKTIDIDDERKYRIFYDKNYLKKSREILLVMSSRAISFAFPVAMTSKVFQ